MSRKYKKGSGFIKAIRFACLHEQNWVCKYCKSEMKWRNSTLDHVVPRSEVKCISKHWRNAVASCEECNNVRNTMPFYEFVRTIASERKPNQLKLVDVWERRKRNTFCMDVDG